MKKLFFFIVIILPLFFLLGVPVVQACDLCQVYKANRETNLYGLGFHTGIAEQFTHFGTLKEDGHQINNSLGQYLDSSITQIYGSYYFTKKIGAQINIPYIFRSYKRADGAGGVDKGTLSGLGDMALTADYLAYRTRCASYSFAWRLLGGLKLPTGSADRLGEEASEIENPVGPESGVHGHDLALGSGSVDGILGTNFYLTVQKWIVTGDVQYAVRTRGHLDYRFANDFHWSLAPGAFLVKNDRFSLILKSKFAGEYKGKDNFNGETADDTGITSVYWGPDLNATWRSLLGVDIGFETPILINNTALQTVPTYRFQSAISLAF